MCRLTAANRAWVVSAFMMVAGTAARAADMEPPRPVEVVKADILSLAESFRGLGDPDRSRQDQLEVLVSELLRVAPQPPVHQRIDRIAGAWQQVWGPYDYSGDKRGVEASIDIDHIYQVVSADGYYYNVNPDPREPRAEDRRIGLLRGVFEVAPDRDDVLNVRFVKFTRIVGCPPPGLDYTDLPDRSEARALPGERWLVPAFLVRWFFGKGALREVYTDADLRITYGSARDDLDRNFIYILRRVESAPVQGCHDRQRSGGEAD